MSDDSKVGTAPGLPAALSRLVGVYLGAFALAATYIAGAASGVGAPTALWRAVIVAFLATVCGRVIGWIAGRSWETSLRAQPVEPIVEAETGT